MTKQQLLALAVDDEQDNLNIFEDCLEAAGYIVHTANDGMDAISYLEENTYSLIISDLAMPRMDGIELLRRIRRMPKYKETYAIVVTANVHMATAELHEMVDQVMSKPIKPRDFVQLVGRIREMMLENRAGEEANENGE